ncbi:MAG: RimK-like protein [Planctomycetia bacterium]|nr:RimK-like protein [Planctomycetia bacterium]
MTIIILGDQLDQHAAYVFDRLCAEGADAELFDTRDFPGRTTLTLGAVRGSGSIRLLDGRQIDFAEITAVYWRNYHGVRTENLPEAEQSYIATNDARSLLESWLIDLPARWVNGWRAFQLHQTKPVQLARVAALGMAVPATLLTNDPEQVREFVAAHSHCIFKPVQGGAHTKRITASHLTDENLANLALAPVTIQQQIVGADIRVFVVGQRVLACEIKTDAIDFRDDQAAPIVPVPLPDDVAEQCLQIAAALELVWTGIDLKRTPDGQYIYLEANPSPMFLGFQERTGLPLGDSLIGLLRGE